MIAVIGGAGYIGSHTVKYLTENNEQVVVFDNLSTGHKSFVPNSVPFIKGDLCNETDLEKLFSSYPSIQTVIHFAASAYVGESVDNPEKYYTNNVANTIHLLKVMRRYDVKQLIFSSTCATYGIPTQTPITESHPQLPINPYGRTKWMVEQIVEDYRAAYDMNYVILRYFNAAGAAADGTIGENHNPETHLIPLVLDAAAGRRSEITIFGGDYETPDGTCIRDYIHVTDLAQAHAKAVKYINEQKESNMFNLGNGSGYSVMEIIKTAEKITKQHIPYQIAARRQGDPAVLIGSSEKARKILNWQPEFPSIEEVIKTAWNWHEKMNGGLEK